jgi:transglutaminase-like putative cysteine protease
LDPPFGAPTFKWRAGVYSAYTGAGWELGDVRRAALSPNDPIDVFSDQSDATSSPGRVRLEIEISPETFSTPTILGPDLIEHVDRAVEALIGTPGDWYASIEAHDLTGRYTMSVLAPADPRSPGGLTEARLRAAGTDYSADLIARFTTLPERAMGPISEQLLRDIRVAVPSGQDPTNPYDLARTMETYIRDPAHFAYAVDVREVVAEQCKSVSTVECFATIRRGYCEFSASTMAVLLRASGIPARVAYGFLPGARDQLGNEVVTVARAHWWVEVFFPGVGWFDFDPDGGIGMTHQLPSGST